MCHLLGPCAGNRGSDYRRTKQIDPKQLSQLTGPYCKQMFLLYMMSQKPLSKDTDGLEGSKHVAVLSMRDFSRILCLDQKGYLKVETCFILTDKALSLSSDQPIYQSQLALDLLVSPSDQGAMHSTSSYILFPTPCARYFTLIISLKFLLCWADMTQEQPTLGVAMLVENKLYTPPISITHCAVQAQCDQHQEKDDGEERGCWHVSNGLSIRDEEEAGSWVREQGRRKSC